MLVMEVCVDIYPIKIHLYVFSEKKGDGNANWKRKYESRSASDGGVPASMFIQE
jgi:hypothetical protein